ncbi:Glycogen debranching enzyme, metazoa family and Six-hairpin glycosidase-like domain and Glycogen debranching enzyme family and Glycoside hydrolase,catalytic domain and Glycoside hydrolase, superfamily domain-containing protein [Strongyloides ratti]|uniref:Glycogen debranching enzyme n=1 Tax=Strongyloides ratti TaxID=34506 RepID=A0A090KUY6_STRRB|nr:Glycogen debranching enzyme, metazoa family and Six-hairpin glycosidase-like domain and Glycogen debranching enzyme family and Glycoside hydrolase,catalytic domain and Glycoside hydrolase, superfamily domain-containing protein [Strongyloides ratti]CEF61325.1 Glycogen debranching enzyme, metazoa family and Six-hairpin glycosidase-like domain and Glycogen debranching enzyme family and Glycoside hydrolase,catalytic domain and Glycoside hydrolase, superfamily domain-containing protein [Strongyloide
MQTKSSQNCEIRIITLEKDFDGIYNLLRLQKGWFLRFQLGETLITQKVSINIYKNKEKVFEGYLKPGIFGNDSFIDVECNIPGSYCFKYKGDNDYNKGKGYYHVEPELIVNGNQKIPLDAISCQTYLTKLLGHFDGWKDKLKVARESGYNMIHLTPIQTLGISDNCYSIADHLTLDNRYKGNLHDVENLMEKLHNKWGMLVIQDVVWNHAAKDAKWLKEHPECTFNCINSPHLRPAYLLDRALLYFSNEIKDGKWEKNGIPPFIDSVNHLNAIKHTLQHIIIPKLRLWEFFQVDIESIIETCLREAGVIEVYCGVPIENTNNDDITIVQDPEYKRFGCTINYDSGIKLVLKKGQNGLMEKLRLLNHSAFLKINDMMVEAIDAIISHINYERISNDGPKLGILTDEHPLVTNYFSYPPGSYTIEMDEELIYDKIKGQQCRACNGWVMEDDPLKNFAESHSQVYLKRQLISWGDSLKLNYGLEPSHCPYLWNYMKEYTETCARLFSGFRINNCHSTPIHVAEYLLNAARKIKPNLYVVAELFTGCDKIDNIFVNKLGITSLIREAQNFQTNEQSKMVYKYGGKEIASFIKQKCKALNSISHTLLYDQTHDNLSPLNKYGSMYCYLPTATLVSAASCAIGSTRGYDEFVTFKIDSVKEKRLYKNWLEVQKDNYGLIKARKLINNLHSKMAYEGYTEVFADQITDNVVAVTRRNPINNNIIVIITHNSFGQFEWNPQAKSIEICGMIDKIIFEIKTIENTEIEDGKIFENKINGVSKFTVEIKENLNINESNCLKIVNENIVEFKNFPSGSIIAFHVIQNKKNMAAINEIDSFINNNESPRLEKIRKIIDELDLCYFNKLLFRVNEEEWEDSNCYAYDIPNWGILPYCGLQGIRNLLKYVTSNNDQDHPLCHNIRSGNWLADYCYERLQYIKELKKVGDVFQDILEVFQYVPSNVRPTYFERVFNILYKETKKNFLKKLNVNKDLPRCNLVAKLLLSSASFVSYVKNAKLSPISKQLIPIEKYPVSLAAGLPHFSVGIWRNWGRDTFISLPGILLLSGRFVEARNIILSYAGTLRHGLIPNLLAEGKGARYNCRDAVWFWLSAIIKYIEIAPYGPEILERPVIRVYKNDSDDFNFCGDEEPLKDVMYEALSKHFNGIEFRERNAGRELDKDMQNEGFNVNAFVDFETGFIFGGNQYNCGTWMDKMGSSVISGNKGCPATPRDGAAVEIQGLAVYILESLEKLFEEWAEKIRINFPIFFYVYETESDEKVNRTGIIKDCFGSTTRYADFQLRPNFTIAISHVPDLIETDKSWNALKIAEKLLMSKLGIKTLDPYDWEYCGNYSNEDSHNMKTACGWNYHQGPEWIWIACYYLKAKLEIGWKRKLEGYEEDWNDVCKEITKQLYIYEEYIDNSLWTSLPELTNENGFYCPLACKAQAWSIGCLLEVIQRYNQLLKMDEEFEE